MAGTQLPVLDQRASILFQDFLTQAFIKQCRLFARCLTGGWNRKNPHPGDFITPVQRDFVARLNRMRRFSNVSIYGNTAGFANCLGDGTARAKATCFEEEIEAHSGGQVSGVRDRVCSLVPDA